MKLVYISHGFTLGSQGRPLLEDEVEAWQYGPVVRRVYGFLPSGPNSIAGPIQNIAVADLGNDERAVVDDVFEKYGSFAGTYLSNLTHREGSPWAKTWKTYGKNAVIPQSLIRDHYAEIMRRYGDAKAVGQAYQPQSL
ncbi:MAG TPA: type II toxin-antitoxin system antitoxin SocA domain-containing protein [Rhizomicrobium sp.]|nr:type II toxin-antitoxin system antitoxin SocA domain-containing protein [Rhizomicrobium sp.]